MLQRLRHIVASPRRIFEHNKSLRLDQTSRVWVPHHSTLGDQGMLNQQRFELKRRDPNASNLKHVVTTAAAKEKTTMALRDRLPELCVMLIGMAALFAWNAVITIPTYWRQRFCGSPLARYHESAFSLAYQAAALVVAAALFAVFRYYLAGLEHPLRLVRFATQLQDESRHMVRLRWWEERRTRCFWARDLRRSTRASKRCISALRYDGACVVLDRLRAAGFEYVSAVEVAGGYDNWVKQYTPAGKKRTGNAKYTNVVGAPGTICAFSEIITQEDGVFDDPTLMRKTRVYD